MACIQQSDLGGVLLLVWAERRNLAFCCCRCRLCTVAHERWANHFKRGRDKNPPPLLFLAPTFFARLFAPTPEPYVRSYVIALQAASVSLHSATELHRAKRTIDLPLRTSSDDPVFVHLDHRSMGVGGDNSWYPNVVHEEYTVPANKAYRFRVLLKPLPPGGAAAPTAAASGPPVSRQ